MGLVAPRVRVSRVAERILRMFAHLSLSLMLASALSPALERRLSMLVRVIIGRTWPS